MKFQILTCTVTVLSAALVNAAYDGSGELIGNRAWGTQPVNCRAPTSCNRGAPFATRTRGGPRGPKNGGGFGPSGNRARTSRSNKPLLQTQGSWSMTCGLKVIENIVPHLPGQYSLPPPRPWYNPTEDRAAQLNVFKSASQKWMDSIARAVGRHQKFQTGLSNGMLYSRFTGNYDEAVVRAAIHRSTHSDYILQWAGSPGQPIDANVKWATVRALVFNGSHSKCMGPHWWSCTKIMKEDGSFSWFLMDSKQEKPIDLSHPETLKLLPEWNPATLNLHTIVRNGLKDGFNIIIDGKTFNSNDCTVYAVQPAPPS